MPGSGPDPSRAALGVAAPRRREATWLGYAALAVMAGLAAACLICLRQACMDFRGATSGAVGEGLAGLAGLALVRAWARRAPWDAALRDPDAVFWAGLGWGLVLFGVLVFVQESARIGGVRYFWLEDDAMVSMRYGARLARGLGLTWTAGPRVEGYSDFLWTLIMAAIQWAGASKALASAWVLALNALCLIWLACAVRRLSAGLGASAMTAALAGLACAGSYDAVGGALSGLEMVAVSAVMAEALARGIAAQRARKPWPWTAFALAGLLPLLRADGGLPAVLVLWLGLRRKEGRTWGRALAAGLLVLGPGLAQEVFRHAYYGAWVPNTYVLKHGAWPGKYRQGALKVVRDLARYPLVFAAVGLAGLRRAWRPWLAVLAVLALYCVWTGADYYAFLRFFAPGWPLFFALGFAAVQGFDPGGVRAALPAALMFLFSANVYWSFPALLKAGWQPAQERLRVALMLKRTIPPTQSLASAWAGSFFYFSGLPGVDFLGKCDAVVASSKPDPSMGGVGHNKLDLDHSLGVLRPDWVLLKAPSYSPSDKAYMVSTYDQRIAADPRFMAFCLPHMRQISPHWALCHCLWPSGIFLHKNP